MRQSPMSFELPSASVEAERNVSGASDSPDDEEQQGSDELAGDYSDLLAEFEADGNLDDAESPDLDIGVSMNQVDDEGDDDDLFAMDIGAVVDSELEREDSDLGDDAGPIDFDPAVGVADLPEELHDDEGLGAEDDRELAEPELWTLDASNDDDEGPAIAEEWLHLNEDDERVAATNAPWRPLEPLPSLEPAAALWVDADGAIAAGDRILRLDSEGVEIVRPRNSVNSVAAFAGAVYFSTVAGELYRATEQGVEALSSWRETAGLGGTAPTMLTLAVGEEELLLHANPGGLFTTPDGRTWRRLGRGRPLSLSRTRSPAAAFEIDDRPTLAVLGSEWVPKPARGAERLLGSDGWVAMEGALCLVARPGIGAAFSTDGAQSFTTLRGSSTVTAIFAARVQSRALGFLALFGTSSGTAEILTLDSDGGLSRIGEIRDDRSTSERAEDDYRVLALEWDPGSHRLLAAGRFGVRGWQPPDA